MTPEILPPDGFERQADSTMKIVERLARNAAMQVMARLAMITVSAMFIPTAGVVGWVGVRIVTTLDRIEGQQSTQNDKLLSIQGKMQLLDLTDLHLDSKLVETDNRLNKRIDQVSDWNRRNATEIDNLKEKVYPLLPRAR